MGALQLPGQFLIASKQIVKFSVLRPNIIYVLLVCIVKLDDVSTTVSPNLVIERM